MKLKFRHLFLIVAYIIFIGAGRDVYSSIILMLAGLYELVDVLYLFSKNTYTNN